MAFFHTQFFVAYGNILRSINICIIILYQPSSQVGCRFAYAREHNERIEEIILVRQELIF